MAERGRVLVIDDEEMVRNLLTSILEADGYAVAVAEDGEKGLQEIAADPPDLVLLGLTMKGMSGWGVINRLRGHAAPPPVVALSGFRDDEPPELGAISPFVQGYLAKPLRADQVLAVSARVLSLADPGSSATRVEAERRTEVRRNLVVPATLSSSNGTPVGVGELLNLTTGGAEFNLGAALPAGAEMRLEFEVPGGGGPFVITVQIEWSQAGRLGLAFVGLQEADSARLAELLRSPA